MSDFDDSASACAIDALSIICKRSTTDTIPFHDIKNDEVTQLFKNIRSGDASRSDLDEASSINALWCGVILVLQSNVYFLGTEDVQTLAAKLPVHVQRFFGAFFSTFELLMEHQRDNRNYLVKSLVLCVRPDANNVDDTIIQMVRDYKSLFSYAYMFNRRTGTSPVSQVGNVTEYFRRLEQSQSTQPQNRALPTPSDNILLLEDDDNDSYDRLMQAASDRFSAPKFKAPTVLPLRPVKLLSDDEHYGSDYQPAAASDLEPDVLYNKNGLGIPPDQDQRHLALLNDDSMYSMDGGSILNSYYKYNGWNNTEEEDEDSADDHYQPPAPVARASRMTRMRQQQQQQQQQQQKKGADKPKKTKKRLTRRSNKDSIRSGVDPSTQSSSLHNQSTVKSVKHYTAIDQPAAVDEPFTYKGGRFRSHEDIPTPINQRNNRWNSGGDNGSVQLSGSEGGSNKSSPDVSSGRRTGDAWNRGRGRDSSSESEQDGSDDDDDASDYSVDDERNYKPSHSLQRTASLTTPANTQSEFRVARKVVPDEVKVEDFEPFPDEERTPVKRHDIKYSSGGKNKVASAVDAHSPSSVGSSIELSDRDRRGNNISRHSGNRTESSQFEFDNNRGETKYRSESTRRIRSILSDEDSDEPKPVTSHQGNAMDRQPASLRIRNPLDASLETEGYVSNFNDRDADLKETPSQGVKSSRSVNGSQRRNPLDESIEGAIVARNFSSGSNRNWADAKSTSTHSTAIPNEVPKSPVVRLPTASPSKQTSNKRVHGGRDTEGPVDLVTSWDSPEISERDDEVSEQRNTSPQFDGKNRYSSENEMSSGRDDSHLAHQLTFQKDHGTQISDRRNTYGAADQENSVSAHTRSTNDRESRAAQLEKMKENILKQKREKERAAAAAAGTTSSKGTQEQQHNQQTLHPIEKETKLPPSALSRSSRRDPSPSRDRVDGQPVSILRKSVTFRDQQISDPSHLFDISDHATDRQSERPPLPDRVESFRMSERGSVDDVVLFGSRQNSGNWGDSSPSPSKSSETSDGISSETDEKEPAQNVASVIPVVNTSRPPLATSSIVKLVLPIHNHYGATMQEPHNEGSAKTSGEMFVSGSKAEVLPDRPTFSRIPSDQLLMPSTSSSPTALTTSRAALHQNGDDSTASQLLASTNPIGATVAPHSANERALQSSSTVLLRQSSASTLSASYSNRPLPPLPTLPDHFSPPPLSEFAKASGIILEGYLHKKSAGIMGQWQKRYFVLAESSTCFCILRIFSRAVNTAWGTVAVGLHTSIPIYSIEAVDTISTPAAKGKQFTIKFTPRSTTDIKDEVGSDVGSVYSDVANGSTGTKITTLMADDAETRMLWVTMLQRALAVAMNEVE